MNDADTFLEYFREKEEYTPIRKPTCDADCVFCAAKRSQDEWMIKKQGDIPMEESKSMRIPNGMFEDIANDGVCHCAFCERTPRGDGDKKIDPYPYPLSQELPRMPLKVAPEDNKNIVDKDENPVRIDMSWSNVSPPEYTFNMGRLQNTDESYDTDPLPSIENEPSLPSYTNEPIDHRELSESVQKIIALYQKPLCIDTIWSIETIIVCPEEHADGFASITWDSESFYACLKIRCDIPNVQLLWMVLHELFELADWETADIFADAITNARLGEETKNLLIYQYRAARSRTLERNVSRYLGHSRPLATSLSLPKEMRSH